MAEKEYIERDKIGLTDFEIAMCNGDYKEALKMLLEKIESIPAADVRPVVKSHWVDNYVAFYRGCPECGAFVRANLDEVFLRDFPSAVGRLNFCPNCGADMRPTSMSGANGEES